MKVLVTGASGFIGLHVCEALEEAGHEVIGLDVSPKASSRYALLIEDITRPLPTISNLDAVIHLAAMANPRECDANPAAAFNANVNGTLQVLRMALASGAKKVVFSSSAHVYGVGPKFLPTPETHPLALGNTYTTTKILGEALCELYWENHGLSYTTLRLFNAYGQNQARGYFIPDMVAKAKLGGINLTDGDTSKDWVYVEDVARAFVLALESPYVGAVNIGTGKETTLSVIAGFLADAAGATFSYTSGTPNESRMCADIGRANRVLGWKPKYSLGDGLAAIVDQTKILALR